MSQAAQGGPPRWRDLIGPGLVVLLFTPFALGGAWNVVQGNVLVGLFVFSLFGFLAAGGWGSLFIWLRARRSWRREGEHDRPVLATATRAEKDQPEIGSGPELQDPVARLQAVLKAHATELERVPRREQLAEVQVLWSQMLHEEIHELADLIAAHPRRDDAAREEGRVLTIAFLAGYAARRGWLEEIQARAVAYRLGRALRDRLREIGIAIDDAPRLVGIVGVVIDRTLMKIVEVGLKAN